MEVNDYTNRYVNHVTAKIVLLRKFGGLTWEDSGVKFTSSKDDMRWTRLTKDPNKNHGGGWFLVAHDTPLYDPSKSYEDNRDSGAIEEVPITTDLCLAIAQYYDENPSPTVQVIRQEEVVQDEVVQDDGDE
jgi:hypothetical protein